MLYDTDFSFGYIYQQASNTQEGLDEFLDEWVFGIKDRNDYIQHYIKRFGYEAFQKLAASFDYSFPVSYSY
ncbi:MAG: hypothetical protein HUK40_03530 [Desulfobacter sp.]|nr:hypothetical protein [Desulfobacter sp.]